MQIVIGLIIAFVLIAIFSNRKTRGCRWREYPGQDQSRWVCVQCGAETKGDRGRPPSDCLKNIDRSG